MKTKARYTSFALAATFCIEAGCAAVTINEGATARFSFDLADVSPLPVSWAPKTRIGFFFIELLPAESFELKVFDEQGDLDPTFSATYTGGTGNSFYDFAPGLSDLDGSFTVTMVSGSAALDEYFVSITSPNGRFYSKKFPNVPEPSSLILGLLSISILTFRRGGTSRDKATTSNRLVGNITRSVNLHLRLDARSR